MRRRGPAKGTGGRPALPEAERRGRQVKVLLSEAELAALEGARQEGESLAGAVRRLALEGAGRN